MPVVAPKTTDVLASVRAALTDDASLAAGTNTLISKTEESALSTGVLKDAVATTRANQGPGATVSVQDAAEEAAAAIERLLVSVNQSGPSKVSQAEVRAVASLNADAGQRVAKAYELLTGKHIDLPGASTPAPPAPPAPGPVSPGPVTPTTSTEFLGLLPETTPAVGLASVSTTSQLVPTLRDDILEIKGNRVMAPGGPPLGLELTLADGTVANAWLPPSPRVRDAVEGLRRALPNHDVFVLGGSSVKMQLKIYPKDTAPGFERGVATYAHLRDGPTWIAGQPTGMKGFNVRGRDLVAGDMLELRIDNKTFTAWPTSTMTSTGELWQVVKAKAVAAGYAFTGGSGGDNGMSSVRVV